MPLLYVYLLISVVKKITPTGMPLRAGIISMLRRSLASQSGLSCLPVFPCSDSLQAGACCSLGPWNSRGTIICTEHTVSRPPLPPVRFVNLLNNASVY
jgi:hypothetical protein